MIMTYFNWEIDFLKMLGELHGQVGPMLGAHSLLDWIMIFFSTLGDAGLLWIGISAIMLIPKRTRRWGIQMFVAITLTFIIGNLIIKNLFHRDRPYVQVPELDLMRIVRKPSEYSFPSGHTMNGFTASITMLFWDKRFGIPAVIVAAIIAFSRMYNTVHFPTDIIAGIGIGIISACVVQIVFRKIEEKKGHKVEV